MILESAALAVAPWVGEWATLKIADAVLGGVGSQLKAGDIDKAIKRCAASAEQKVKLFYSCDPRFVPGLLNQVFKDLGLQELQKPLKNEGTPQVAYLVKAFQVALEDHPKVKEKINQSFIEPWLEVFAKKYFESTNAYLSFQVAKEDYFKQLSNYFDDVKFTGKVEGQEVEKSAHLAQIFVMPDVEEMPERESVPFERDFDLENPGGSRQTQLLWEQRQLSQLQERSGRKFSAQHLLSETTAHKFVLLGSPGSGKTTLMSYFAVMLAEKQPQELGLSADTDWLPILIRVRDLARHPNLSPLEYIQQFTRATLSVKQLPAEFFEYWLEDGRALILLDGLDEVADLAKRHEIVLRIENFLGKDSQNRVIITSRPAGYRRDFFRTNELPHYQLQLFDESKIEQFVKRWYKDRFKDSAEAQRRQESLLKALAGQKRIQVLAKNPLLLTIIALIHRYEAPLPRQRYKLYDRAVKTLLTTWDAGKDFDYKWPLEYLNRDDIERLMQQLAYWIHTQGGTGDKEGGTLIEKDELITQLSKFIANQKKIERHQAKAEAERFIKYIRERCGLLNEQGQDCYAFVHKTFQEYLTAEEIRYRQEDEDFEVVLEHIRNYLHNSHWQEVLLLLIAQQKPKKATRVLEEILQQPTPYEQWLHRNLFFAGNCLAENIEVSENSLVERILYQLVDLEVSDSPLVSSEIRSQVFQIICNLNQTQFQAQMLKILKDSAEQTDEAKFQQYRAALGEKEEVITTLLIQLQDEDAIVRSNAIWVLSNLKNVFNDNDNDKVKKSLINQLHDNDAGVRSSAIYALGNLQYISDLEEDSLLVQLLEDQDIGVRSSVALALENSDKVCDLVKEALLATLEKDENAVVRSRVASIESLWNAFNDSERKELLIQRLQDKDTEVIASITLMLGKLKNTFNDSETEELLIQRLKDKDFGVRTNAAWALGKLRNVSELTKKTLIARLTDVHSFVRASAATALGNLENPSDSVIEALQIRLQDNSSLVCADAAKALVKLGKPSMEIVQAVIQWIEQHEDSGDIGYAIDTLWDLVSADTSV